MGYADGSVFTHCYRGVQYTVVHQQDSGTVFVVWAGPMSVLQSLLCVGLCPAPFAIRIFPSTTSLDILHSLNAKKETQFS